MHRGAQRAAWAILLTAAVGCGAPTHPSAPALIASASVARGSERAFSDLRAALNEVRDPGDPLDALSPEMLRLGRSHIEAMAPSERDELMRSAGSLAKDHPIFYLLAGGRDQTILALVRQHSDADLTALWRGTGHSDLHGLREMAVEVGRRSATHWLALTGARLKSVALPDVATCDEITHVATSIGLMSLGRSAVEMAVTREPTPERWLMVANAAAMALDVRRAREAIREARDSAHKPSHPLPIRESEQRVANAELALARTEASPDALLAKARALAALGRVSDVIDLLRPHLDIVRQHAGLATTLAVATFSYWVGHHCPVGSGTDLSQECLVMLDQEPAMKEVGALAREAWRGAQGRDREAAETYTGLFGMMPLAEAFFAARSRDSNNSGAKDIMREIDGLQHLLAEAVTVAPELEGLRLYADTLRHFIGQSSRADDWTSAERAAFEAHATEVAKHHGQSEWGQTGVTFAAALLSVDGNATALIDELPPDILPRLRRTRALIRLWGALVERKTDDLEAARAGFSQLVAEDGGDPVRQKMGLLLVAEIDAHTASDADRAVAYRTLGELASTFSSSPWPPELRVRAALDKAGVLSRAQNSRGAISILAAIPASDIAQAGHIGVIVNAYRRVLQAKDESGSQRQAFIDDLQKISAENNKRATGVWLDMWLRELRYLSATESCPAGSACEKKARALQKTPRAFIDDQIGHWLSALLLHGGLDLGAFNAGLGWSDESRIFSSIDFDFALPAVEFPSSN